MTDYNDGKWHIWNGGACPVHPESVVDIATEFGPNFPNSCAKYIGGWEEGHFNRIIAFRVTKPWSEPKTYTGECFAYHYTYLAPTLTETQLSESVPGQYTATHINGKLSKIVWEASE